MCHLQCFRIFCLTDLELVADYSHLFRRSEGCFLNIEKPENIEASLEQYSPEDVDIIVCSDGEQILGTNLLPADLLCPLHSEC